MLHEVLLKIIKLEQLDYYFDSGMPYMDKRLLEILLRFFTQPQSKVWPC